MGEGLDGGQILEVPGLADGEGAIVVLAGLVHAYATGAPDGDDDDTGLLVLGSRRGRRRSRGMGGILDDADVGDVRLGHCVYGQRGLHSGRKSKSGQDETWHDNIHWPLASTLEKQLSIMRRFSSSNRSARLAAAAAAAVEVEVEVALGWWPGGGGTGGLRGSRSIDEEASEGWRDCGG